MISRIHLSAVLLLGAMAWGVLLVIGGVSVSISWIKPLSTVTGLLLILLGAFDRWLWRLPILQGWFVDRPDIRGTWRAKLDSSWLDTSTGEASAPITAYIVVRQTYTSLSLRLMTKESSSELVGAQFRKSSDGVFQLAGVYRNEPRQMLRQQSPIHYGAILLEVRGKPVNALTGHYWTDRNTNGEIYLENRLRKIFTGYEAAAMEFSSVLPIRPGQS